jgi:hypothetical protein
MVLQDESVGGLQIQGGSRQEMLISGRKQGYAWPKSRRSRRALLASSQEEITRLYIHHVQALHDAGAEESVLTATFARPVHQKHGL